MSEKGFRSLDTGIFGEERSNGYDTVSERIFYLALGLAVAYGLGLTLFISNIVSSNKETMDLLATLFKAMSVKGLGGIPSILLFFALFLGIPIVGSIISSKSDNAIISFFGYNLIVLPFGVLNSILFMVYESNSIYNIFFMTLIVSGMMCCLGVMFPKFFASIGGTLFTLLTGLLVAMILRSIFFAPSGKFGIIDLAGTIIFSLYIGYDFHRAQTVSKTLDNAVDIAVQIYLDILNLFLLLLKAAGKKK